MGAGGEDLIMARACNFRQKFPHSIECKNVESYFSIFGMLTSNLLLTVETMSSIVVIKKNGKKPLVVVDAEYYIQMFDK